MCGGSQLPWCCAHSRVESRLSALNSSALTSHPPARPTPPALSTTVLTVVFERPSSLLSKGESWVNLNLPSLRQRADAAQVQEIPQRESPLAHSLALSHARTHARARSLPLSPALAVFLSHVHVQCTHVSFACVYIYS
jgi:hypothetical protein